MNTYKVNEKCIGCMACVRIAGQNFQLDGNKKAQVVVQPKTKDVIQLVEKAMAACPTEAIEKNQLKVILGHHNVRETFETHPELKTEMVDLSPKFKSLFNPIMWNSMAKFATFETASQVTNVSLCEILHRLNSALGIENELLLAFPDCIVELSAPIETNIISEIAVSIQKAINYPTVLDVRSMKEDPFDKIIQLAYKTQAGESFTLIQTFKPDPMIKMLDTMGFDSEILSEKVGEVKLKFTKNQVFLSELSTPDIDITVDTPELTIQSATPVGYPIIMRLLQSKRLLNAIKIKELKVWDETEKHLAWIVNGRADISFSAVITATKFKTAKIKMPVVFVWDNFVLLTRNVNAQSFADLKGETIRLPLFEDAPPAKLAHYLVEMEGMKGTDFKFEYGNPFGRPAEMMIAFAEGKINHVLLREPEASFAIAKACENGLEFSEIRFSDLFNHANPDFGQFPNAGVMVKESLYQTHPQIMALFEAELESAIEWVNSNPRLAAELSYDMLRNSVDNVEAFIKRVTFNYQSGKPLVEKMKKFYNILSDNEILQVEVDDQLLGMFEK